MDKDQIDMSILNNIKKKYLKCGCTHIGITFDYNCNICKYNNFIERSIMKYGNKYDYSDVVFIDYRTKVKIKCNIHGYFLQTPADHCENKVGCRKCHFNNLSHMFKKSKEEFIRDARIVHGDKYDYSNVDYINNKVDVIIKCKSCNFIFKQKPDKHINDVQGCPACRKSKGETLISTWLSNNKIEFVTEKTFDHLNGIGGGKLRYDFYIPCKNLLIEYDGLQHFIHGYFNGIITTDDARKQAKIHDELKSKYAKDNGIILLRIPYTKINKIDTILNEKIL